MVSLVSLLFIKLIYIKKGPLWSSCLKNPSIQVRVAQAEAINPNEKFITCRMDGKHFACVQPDRGDLSVEDNKAKWWSFKYECSAYNALVSV